VSITTDKTEYEQGKAVKITIENNSDREITFGVISLEMETGGWTELWSEEGEIMIVDTFEELVEDIFCDCNVKCNKLPLAIEASLSEEYAWDQEIGLCDKLPLNKKLRFKIRSWNSGYINYSNEFTIKERSAFDARCGEKVEGVGFCRAFRDGYEFNSETGKCIKKGASGCSFGIPFATIEECQEVCEKKEPKDKESCEKLGGTWMIRDVEVCSLPTSDSEKECSDSSQCEGYCIAELSEKEYKETMQGTIIYTEGKCTAKTTAFGCAPHVDDGKVNGILCMD